MSHYKLTLCSFLVVFFISGCSEVPTNHTPVDTNSTTTETSVVTDADIAAFEAISNLNTVAAEHN